MSTVEDLWKTLEVRKPKSRRSLIGYNSEDRSETSERTGNSTCESQGTEDDFSDDPFGIHPDGDLADCDQELELINLNRRTSREFSLSRYDVGVHQVQRRVYNGGEVYNEDYEGDLGDIDNYDPYSNRVNVVDTYHEGDAISNERADSGHVICDCDDCINQTEAVECHCDNCVQARGATLHSPHASSPREITCDCEECLNHSGDSYVCTCENCLNHEANQAVSLNNNHPDDLCKCPECYDQGTQHQQDMCNCSKCASELRALEQGIEHIDLSPRQKTHSYANEFKPIHRHNGLSKTLHKPVYVTANTDSINIDDGATYSGNVQSDNEGYFINDSDDRRYVDDERNLSEGSLEGIDFVHEGYTEDCDCEECREHSRSSQRSGKQQQLEPPLTISALLEDQLQKAEKDLKKKTSDYETEVKDLRKENEKQQKIIQQSLSLGPDAKIEATMQHEITRLTSENLDLREVIDKQADQIRKLKKMLKVYAKRLKDGDAAEIQAELEQEETKSVENVAQIKHRARNYMGMLEYKKEDENTLIKFLVLDLKPRVASGLLPGLPAYLLFMCVRHTDYINDDEKVRSFLTSTINGIKKVVKKHHDDIDRVALWLANTCRFLHNLKQYSGEKAFQQENTPRQNEHCLRNFDLSEYRQVFSDLAVWIYQTLIKLMEATIQPSIVAAVLEHEAIAGLTGSKPSGLRGRSSSRTEDTPEHSLDSLMKALGHFVRVMTQNAVDPELIKQIYRQLYYFIGASALNNLLLRKEMCNWSKGMQVRYNLSHLEQWLRDNKLQESGAGSTLETIVQASQLLQARKTDADVDSVCDMCSKLSVAQIVKILNLYTPVDEFEERVPISFIRKIQEKLKTRDNLEINNSLLMDLKYSFSVTFPFNPSKIALETIEVPDGLHLGNTVTRL